MASEGMLAAITAAVDNPPEVEEKDDDAEGEESTDEGDADLGDEGSGDENGDSGTEADDGEGSEGDEEASDDDAAADDPAEGAEGTGKDGKPAAKDPAAPAAPKDHINDPLDPRLKESTRERITGLINVVKEQTTRAETAEAQFNEVIGYIQDAGATPAQYGQALDYIKAVNSGDMNQIEKAFAFMEGEYRALARMLGREAPGVDYLAGHADLQAEVTAGKITQARAKEIAVARDAQAHGRAVNQQQQQQQQTQEQRAAVLTQGRNELNTLGAQLRAANPAEYAAKSKVLTAALKGTFASLDPRQWAAAYKRAYDNLVLPAAAPAPAPAKKSNLPKNQPLRGQNPAGGQASAPKSMFDAINAAVEAAGR